jgi:type IV secretory pathway protease TraF
MRPWLLACTVLVFLSGCIGRGVAGRAAALPQPTNLAQWLATAVFVIGLWWIVFKIIRG